VYLGSNLRHKRYIVRHIEGKGGIGDEKTLRLAVGSLTRRHNEF
jgi:hypothetical protein